jgi:hypothetical protein
MRRIETRIPLIFMGFLGFGACDDSTTLVLDVNPATRIVIDSSRCPQVQKCARCQLEFDAFDRNGQPAQFPTIAWTSSNPAVATVDALGRVDGWATGIITVVAEVLETGATDDVTIPVTPPSSPSITCTPPGALTVPGDAR